jgi:hypothetical protein
MPAPYDPADVELWVSPTGVEGTFVQIMEMTSQDANRGTEGLVKTDTFGRATPHTRAGRKTSSYSLSGLLNFDDPGQTILRDAYDDGSAIWYRRLFPDDHRVTEEGRVTEAPDSAERDGDWVENGFTIEAVGAHVKDEGPANDP